MVSRLRSIAFLDDDREDFLSWVTYENTIFNEWKHLSEIHERLRPIETELHIEDHTSDLENIQWRLHTKSDKTSNTVIDDAFKSIGLAEEGNAQTVACSHCAGTERVLRLSDFSEGQHISMPGQYGTFYQHHAIVSKVNRLLGKQVELELIQYLKDEEKVFNIIKNKTTYNLPDDELYIKKYKHTRWSSKDIVNRANIILNDSKSSKFGKYSLIFSNCEHFATWCVTGEDESLQVQEALKKCAVVIASILGNVSPLVNIVEQLVAMSTDDIATSVQLFIAPAIELKASAGVYFLYCLANTVYLSYQYKKKNICGFCLKKTLKEMWLGLGLICGTTIVQYLIYTFAVPAFGNGEEIPLIFNVVVLSMVNKLSVNRFVRILLRNPFEMDKSKIERPSQIRLADIVDLRYYLFEHLAIVSEIIEVNETSRTAKVRCIHYGGSFFCAEIVEEEFEIQPKSCNRYDVNGPRIYSREERLSLARKRIGEKRWSVKNRSVHFCNWATVKDPLADDNAETDHTDEELSAKGKAVKHFLNTKPVYIDEELRLGDVVDYKTMGILVNKKWIIEPEKQTLEIHLINLVSTIVTTEKYKIDLKVDNIYLMKCHPACCISRGKRVKRAERAERVLRLKNGHFSTQDAFIEACILQRISFLDSEEHSDNVG